MKSVYQYYSAGVFDVTRAQSYLRLITTNQQGQPLEKLDAKRWQALWKELGAAPPPGSFDQLVAAYSEPQRHYHGGAHILACLAHLDRWKALCAQPALAELALWTHDLIYDTRRQDNEAASAALTAGWLRQAGLEQHAVPVSEMVLATTHQAPATGDAALVVDIDLSILATPPAVYDAYCAAIREEFAWVPETLFRQGRARLLANLLQMPRLYQREELAAFWEEPARSNLERELAQLARQHEAER